MPRPLAIPVRRLLFRGDGRLSQFEDFAAAFTTSIKRESLKWRRRYSTGSAFNCAATSSRNDSCANVFCNRAGDRSGPVQNGDTTSCERTRSLRTLPVPPLFPFTVPVIYEGAALLLLAKFVGSGAGVLAAKAAGWKPRRKPVTTFT